MNLQRGFFRLTLILSIIMGVVGIIYYATGGSLLSEGLNVLWWVGSVWVLYGFIRYVVIGFVIGGFKSREVGTNFLKKKTIPILISVAVLLLCAAFIQFLYKQKKVINFTPLPERQLDWGRIQKMYEAGGIYYEKKDMPDFLTDKEMVLLEAFQKFREKYPEYNDMSDIELAEALARKYPEYADLPETVKKIAGSKTEGVLLWEEIRGKRSVYKVEEKQTGKIVEFEWFGLSAPTDEEMEKIFRVAEVRKR